MIYAIILAGGNGQRAGLDIPKQFYKVNQKPILVYTLEKFQSVPLVDFIYVVCDRYWEDEVMSYKSTYGLTKLEATIESGETGVGSAYNGIMNINCNENDIVMIHDTVRPFIDSDIIEDNIQIALRYGCAMTAVNCVETLVYSKDGMYSDKILSRNGIWRIQTPQTFRYKDIYNLFLKIDVSSCKEPSVFAVWMNYGKPIYCSKGKEENFKITYFEDIKFFEDFF